MTAVFPILSDYRDEFDIIEPQHYIYGLWDPTTGELRYVGKSDRPRERLSDQLKEKAGTHRCHWVQSLVAQGLAPDQRIIDAVPFGDDWQAVERAYIAGAKTAGCRLTNATVGGDGVVGLSGDSLTRLRRTWVGRKHRPESLVKIGAASKGRRHTPEYREHMRRLMSEREFTTEHRNRIRAATQKLSVDDVCEIRRLIASGMRQRDIAERFGIHQGSVSNIARGKTYIGIGVDE